MAKKKKEEEARKLTQSKPVPQNSSKKVNTPEHTINEPRELPSNWEERASRHNQEERTVVLTNEPSPSSEPTLKDIFKQLLEGGGDIHKEPVKPKVEPKPFLDFDANRKSSRIAQETRTLRSQEQSVSSKALSTPSHQKLRKVIKNTSLRDMVVAKAILDTPYINKEY